MGWSPASPAAVGAPGGNKMRRQRTNVFLRSERDRMNGAAEPERVMIRKLSSGGYRLYSRKKNPKTGRRRNLGTFTRLAKAKQHERAVQYFKRR